MRYEIREREDGKKAIFDENGKQISQWFDSIGLYGLVSGQSKYYIAKANKGEKFAVYDVYGNQISPEMFDMVFPEGLLKGQSEYYIAVSEINGEIKFAIFDVNGNQITKGWFDWVYTFGLVEGKSDYYIACNGDNCAVYHKNGQKVSEEFPKDYMNTLDVNFNDSLGVVEIGSRSIDFNPVCPFKEEIIDYTKLLNI
jgi:hypothetical protein